jgi:alkaline phosphatase D
VPAFRAGPELGRIRLRGLEPDTRYVYRVTVDGRSHPAWVGSFKTPPLPGTPVRFRVATASCMKPDFGDQTAWSRLLAERPDVLLLLGDNIYADSPRRNLLWREHTKMRRIPEFAEVVRNVPTYAIWDDHDFAGNNTDGTARGKEESLRTFRELWPNPSAGLRTVPGVFFRFAWGDVDFYMLDVRYHRSPNGAPDGPSKWMFGAGQLQWLLEGLRTSNAGFKILASGSTLHAKGEDSWIQHEYARRRLFGLIARQRTEGLLFLTGDLHRSEIHRHPASWTGFYDLFEVISSGIANSSERSFATLTIDTTVPDPTIRMRIHLPDGSLKDDRSVSLSELRMP